MFGVDHISLFLKLISFSLEISDNITELTAKDNNTESSDLKNIEDTTFNPIDIKQRIVKTNFKNKELIQKSIISYGLKLNQDDSEIISFLENGSMKFQKNANGPMMP